MVVTEKSTVHAYITKETTKWHLIYGFIPSMPWANQSPLRSHPVLFWKSLGSCRCPKDAKIIRLRPRGRTKLLEEHQLGSKSLASWDELQALGRKYPGGGGGPCPGSMAFGPVQTLQGTVSLSLLASCMVLSFPYIEFNYDQERKCSELLLARRQEEACS